ncbi:MAG: hypothetical protein LUC43_01135 [Burkholderiales bacterium]|nr:hypothetical protein [Burkholderiales bacterium]
MITIHTVLNLCFLTGCGFLIGFTDSSIYWGIIPIIIGTYIGCWYSQFAKALSAENVSPLLREKLLQAIRTLAFMWLFISVCFVLIGYFSAHYISNNLSL